MEHKVNLSYQQMLELASSGLQAAGIGEKAAYEIIANPSSLHEAHLLKLDCTKAKKKLGWQSKWDIHVAIEKICDWHKAYLNGDDMYQYCLNDIKMYSLQ
jgi:CDP-glucose 4,6-dehydratase